MVMVVRWVGVERQRGRGSLWCQVWTLHQSTLFPFAGELRTEFLMFPLFSLESLSALPGLGFAGGKRPKQHFNP